IDTVLSSIAYTLGANVENLTLTGTANINGVGNDLNNVITGNSGNNVLAGGLGADTMIGGLGNDTYVVDNIGDVIVENAGEGTDTVYSNLASYTLGSNLENMILYGTDNINGVGNDLNNVITGNSGNNVLSGGLGADTLIGGLGNDTYVVDDVGDVIVENAGEGTDTVYSNLTTYTLGANLENLILYGTGNINGTGNEVNNVLTGNSGNNTLDGGLGADTMIGGLGNDTYVVDNIGDVVVENAGEGIDTVLSSIAYTLGANVENLTLTGTANINGVGNDFNNVITGNSGNNVLAGGLGADTMIGGQGNDTYVVDNIGDVIVENAGEGTDTVYSNLASYTLGSNLENLILYGTGNISGTGNELNNVIIANSGNDNLYGGAGNDTLYAGAGNDLLDGGLGNDTYVIDIGCGNETINSYVGNNIDNGFDTLQFQNIALSGMSFTKNGNDLICTIGQTGKTIDVSNWFLGANYQVDQFQFADGTLTATQVSQKIA
ncbi:calcium-binding protein, partial [Pelosinus sp. IPA-1]|uniref:calcium-binding protein n=1 Tax=Pelosinus sp. IPA-1 TaxID=3029569 RepID=UPI00255683A9